MRDAECELLAIFADEEDSIDGGVVGRGGLSPAARPTGASRRTLTENR